MMKSVPVKETKKAMKNSLDGFSAEGEDDDDDDDGDASQDKATTASENSHDIFETTSLSPKLPESSTAALPPPAYVCPITQELMNDPVTTLDGHTFERAAIEHWFETNDASPRTGKLLRNKLLIPNIALREQIEIFRIEHGYPPIQPPYHPSSEELAEGAQDGDGGEASIAPATTGQVVKRMWKSKTTPMIQTTQIKFG